MYTSKFGRNSKRFLVIILIVTIVLFAYLFVGSALKRAVEGYLKGIGYQHEIAADIAGKILKDVESWLVPIAAGIILLLIASILTGVYLARLRNEIKKSQNALKNAIDAANIIIITLSQNGTVLNFNKHAEELFHDIGIENPESFLKLLSQKDREKLIKRMVKHPAPDLSPHFELKPMTEDGHRHLYCSLHPTESEKKMACCEILAVDITERARKEIELKESHEELKAVYEKLEASEDALKAQLDELTRQKAMLQESEARYELVIDASQIGILDWDAQEKKIRCSGKWHEVFDYDQYARKLCMKKWEGYILKEDAEKLRSMVSKHLAARSPYMVCEFRYKKNRLKWIHAVGKILWDSDGRLLRMAWAFTDVTAQKEAEEEVRKLAYTDLLTGLPNKISLSERFTGELEKDRAVMALLLIDLDDFKLVNETYGHVTGDKILVEMAKRLKPLIRDNMFLARMGGDEFAILIWNDVSDENLSSFAQEIEDELDGFVFLDEANIRLSTSIGITRFPEDAQSFDGLFKNAEMAMYKAKVKRCKYLFYHGGLNAAVVERLNLINYLKGALECNEFTIHYQPQYDIRNKRIVGLEALLRWENKYLGKVSPAKFIPIAEETRLIVPIGEYVLRSALAFLRKLREMGHDQLIMCVNISTIQLMQKDFTGMVLDILRENQIPSRFLELEITESILLDSAAPAMENIAVLREAGVKIALDDFGTGYSSMNYLMRLPINTLKIDKSFIDNIGQARGNELLVSAIMNIGRRLGLTIVAEGVEHQEQLEYLLRRKCDRVQGFLLSKPLCEEETELLLGSGRRPWPVAM